MDTVTPAIRDFARRLVALEAARPEPPVPAGVAATRVCDGLRRPLSKLAGVAGFRSLLSRAVALARAEDPTVVVEVRPDGSLEGLDRPGGDLDAGAAGRAGAAVVAQLLGLLVTFIGKPLTLNLVRDAWPDARWTETDAGSGGGS